MWAGGELNDFSHAGLEPELFRPFIYEMVFPIFSFSFFFYFSFSFASLLLLCFFGRKQKRGISVVENKVKLLT